MKYLAIMTLLGLVAGGLFYSTGDDNHIDIPLTDVVDKVVDVVVVERGFIDTSEKYLVQSYVEGNLVYLRDSGSQVKKGDILFTIESSETKEDISAKEAELAGELLTLESQRNRLKLTEAEAGNEVIVRMNALKNARIKQREELSKPKTDDLRQMQISLQLAVISEEESAAELKRNQRLFDKGFLSAAGLEPFKRSYITRQEKVKDAKLNISIAKKGVTDDIRLQLEQLVYRAEASLKRVENRKQRTLLEQQGLIKMTERRIARLEYELKTMQDKVSKSVHYAEHDGFMIVRQYWNRQKGKYMNFAAGNSVRERDTVAEVINPDKLVANVIFNEADFHNLQEGQQVELTLPAFPDRQFSGKLAALGAIGRDRNELLTELSGTSDVSMYNAIIELNEDLTGLQQGMSVIVKVRLDKPHRGLVVPRTAVKVEKDKCWVLVNGRKKEISGKSVNEFDFEVTAGLGKGESVATVYQLSNSKP